MAQGNVIERFFIALGLDTKDVEKGINKTVDTVKGGLKELLVGAVLPAVGALASGALVQQFTEEITQVDRLSKSLGINIERLQQWQGVAENAGVAGEEIGEIFADLNDWMVDADQNQSGAMYEYIEKGLLPAVRDVNGAMKSTEQYALELADAFAAMDKQQATGIGRQIGIGNAGLVAMFQQGSASISAQMQQIKQLGVYTEDDAKAAKEFSIAIKDLSRALKMLLLPLFRIVAPAATFIARGIQEATKHTAAFMPVLIGLAAVLSAALYPALIKNAKAALAFLASPWGILLAALTAIGLLLDDFVTWLEGGESAFGDFYESIFGDAENAKKTLGNLWEKVKPFLKLAAYAVALSSVLSVLYSLIVSLNAIMGVFGITSLAALGPIALAIGAIIGVVLLLHAYWDDLVQAFKDAFAWLTEKISWLGDKMSALGDAIDFTPDWDFKDVAKMAGFYDGDAALATPGTAGTTTNNNTTNNETKVDGKVNITIQGNADREAIQQAQGDSSKWFSGLTAQGNASQPGI